MKHEHDNLNPHNREAVTISKITILINLLLASFKAFAGIVGHSPALIADSLHGFSDAVGSFIIIIGAYIGNKRGDEAHPLLQTRIESIISLILIVPLFLIALEIGLSGIRALAANTYEGLPLPTLLPLTVAVMSIIVKEFLYRYTAAHAKKIDSVALRTMAWHHRTDALITVGSLMGILGSRMGLPIFDPLASLLISLLVVKVIIDILIEAIKKLALR